MNLASLYLQMVERRGDVLLLPTSGANMLLPYAFWPLTPEFPLTATFLAPCFVHLQMVERRGDVLLLPTEQLEANMQALEQGLG